MTFDHLQKLVAMMFVPDGTGGAQQRYTSVDVKTLNPLVAAYVGDAYFSLFVRGRLLSYEQAKVQVLKFGTLYAMRAQKLADAYRQYGSMERSASFAS